MKICNVWPNYTCPKYSMLGKCKLEGPKVHQTLTIHTLWPCSLHMCKDIGRKKNKKTYKTHQNHSFQHTQNVSYHRLRYPHLYKYAMFGQTTHVWAIGVCCSFTTSKPSKCSTPCQQGSKIVSYIWVPPPQQK